MNWTCIFIDLSKNQLIEKWEKIEKTTPIAMKVKYTTLENMRIILDVEKVANLVIACDDTVAHLDECLSLFFEKVGCLPSFVLIISDNPSPEVMACAYDYGIEKICSFQDAPQDIIALIDFSMEKLENPSSSERKNIDIMHALKNSSKEDIEKIIEELQESSQFDFLAAFARGKAFESKGNYQEAANLYVQAQSLNHYFKPSTMQLSEVLLINGNSDKAIEHLEDLEESSGANMRRKILLASAFTEKDNFEKTEYFINQACILNKNSSKIHEARAISFLKQGKNKEALQEINKLESVGPFFATALNKAGVTLSKENKNEEALELYSKAHRIIRPELKYKISLNAALACRRAESFDTALKYIFRTKREFGGSFEKLDKIEQDILLRKRKKSVKITAGT